MKTEETGLITTLIIAVVIILGLLILSNRNDRLLNNMCQDHVNKVMVECK